MQSVCIVNTPIYVLLTPTQMAKIEEENVQFFKEEMIRKAFYYHILAYNQ